MSDIKGQLIKNSYNYVLQSDLISGIVYRIGGDVPNNPKFISGLTVNTNFTYSNGSEVDGYVLTCDASGNATWGPVSASTPSSGVTSVTATNGISGNVTTGAIILVNTAPDQIVTISGGTGITTGGTYPNFTLVNSAPDQTVIITGGTNIQISGSYPSFGVNYTGATIIQGITGITGSSGVSAITNDYGTSIVNTAPDQTVTISGGTGITTGGTYPNFTLVNSAPDQTVIITGGTNIQITGTYPDFGVNFTGSTSSTGDYLPLSGGTITGSVIIESGLTANTISATIYNNLPIPTLQEVTDSGNTTTNNIVFQSVAEAQFGSGGGVLLANNSRLREGTIDAGTGGNKGIAQICGAGYELKWEGGRLYVMNDGGLTIREVRYTLNNAPSTSDDIDKGYLVGSRWVLDNGDLYLCTDNTSGNAVWEKQIGVSTQIAYYNVDGILTGDTGFTRSDETNNFVTTINSVKFTNPSEYQETAYEYDKVRSRVYKDNKTSGETILSEVSYTSIITNYFNGYYSGLDISENGGSFRFTDSNENYNGFNYTSGSVGWSVIVGNEHYFYNLPQSEQVVGGVLTDVNGNGTLTWVVPTLSTFTGGTVSGATNFTGGLTANTIFATDYLNLPTDIRTTGATYSNNTFTFTNNTTGGTYSVLFNTVTGLTVNGNLTVTGNTNFIKINTSGMSVNGDISVTGISSLKGVTATGLTVNGNVTVTGTTTTGTISATTYQNLPTYISAVTESANVFTVSSNAGSPTTLIVDAVTGGTYSAGQITLSGTGNVNGTQISTKVLPIALTVVSNTASTDASLSSTFTLTLTGNTTLATPTNGFSSQRILYQLKQDGTGSKILTLSSGFRSGPITVTLSTAANTTDYLGVIYNEIDNEWDVLALNKGYS